MKLPNEPKVLAATIRKYPKHLQQRYGHNVHKMFTVMVDFPTVLLAELRTHKILTQGSLYEHSEITDLNLSANSARAIPTSKYLQKIIDHPFVPIWTKNQSGMSGKLLAGDTEFENEYVGDTTLNDIWKNFIEEGDGFSLQHIYNELLNQGVHKQNANRLLAPFAWTTCVLSGTEWDNFFELRCPKYKMDTSYGVEYHYSKRMFLNSVGLPDLPQYYENWTEEQWQEINESAAQPEFQVIAEKIYDLYRECEWKESKYHIPFEREIKSKYHDDILNKMDPELLEISKSMVGWELGDEGTLMYYIYMMNISASMCAKLSYDTQDKEDTFEKHLERADMLATSKHWEPYSHQAVVMDEIEYECFARCEPYTNTNKNKYCVVRNVKLVRGEVTHEIKQGITFGHAYNLRGFKSFRYILENEM